MFLYYLFYFPVWLLTWLPLRVLYFISDLLYPVLYYLIGYRRKVVRLNLINSFPDKTEKEIVALEKKFYRFFCDMLVETLYEIHLSNEEIQRRMTFENVELVVGQHAKGKSVMVMTAHYANWEWGVGVPLSMPEEYITKPIYKRQRNVYFNKLICNLREKYGAELVEKKELLREMVRMQKAGSVANYWMVSDQTPNAHSIHYWTKFLNQETAAVVGTEQLARKFGCAVVYAEFSCRRRGHYHCKFVPVELEPDKTSNYEITEKYMRLLEKTIEAQPEYWLWSHKRWKHRRKNNQ